MYADQTKFKALWDSSFGAHRAISVKALKSLFDEFPENSIVSISPVCELLMTLSSNDADCFLGPSLGYIAIGEEAVYKFE